jgi:NADH:ubiquinone oxidoreductase subunit D
MLCHGYWSFNAFYFAFEQREKLMEFYERVCGAECTVPLDLVE